MVEFYRFPYWVLTALLMVIALGIVLQTRTISYSIRRLRTGWVRRVENGLECAVLVVLFLFATLLAQVQYALYGGFLASSTYDSIRQVVFLLTAVLGTTVAVGTEIIWPFFVVGGTAVAGRNSILRSLPYPSRKPLIPCIPDYCSFVRRGISFCATTGWMSWSGS